MLMPVDQPCVEALYNYVQSFLAMMDNRMDAHITEDLGEMSTAFIGMNSGSRMMDYWAHEVETRCGVRFDEAKAAELSEKELREVHPILKVMAEETGRGAAELEAESLRKMKEAERSMYG